jgi:ABC-type multidrug transport system ATPase subunit
VTGERILSVRNVTKRYGRLTALDDVSFNLATGSIVALLGPNGAGKTTTFKCVLGVTPFEGAIRVAGRSVRREGKSVRRLIGYLPQTPAFLGDDTCSDALRFLADLRRVPRSRVGELLERVHLADQRDTPVEQLSGGMRQRLALAAALLSDPPLLLLDEPTANLDFESRGQFQELLVQLREEGKTVVLSTHFVEHLAHLADRVVLLRGGRVVLDKQIGELWVEPERQFSVHLNGTPTADFMRALKSVGISEERVSLSGASLESAISRALQADDQAAEEER